MAGDTDLRMHPTLRVLDELDTSALASRTSSSGNLAMSAEAAERLDGGELSREALDIPEELPRELDRMLRDILVRDPVGAPSSDTQQGPPPTLGRDDYVTSVFVSLRDGWMEADWQPPKGLTWQRGNIFTGELTHSQLSELLDSPEVALVEPAEELKPPRVRIGTMAAVGAAAWTPDSEARAVLDGVSASHRVLIGIIDVQGFDFSHRDFLDAAGGTRFVRIWDQGGGLRRNPRQPTDRRRIMFPYGSEIEKEHMDRAIAASAALGVAPWELEPQSQQVPASHGTHVASIAGGNSGVCPQALLAGVLVDLQDITDSRQSFYDTSRIVHAVEYLADLAREYDAALAINISLGTNGHAHDASSAGSRWLDALTATPGRVICVAAGNAGQERAAHDGDYGWIMGRIHSEGRIAAPGLTWDLEWLVFGNGLEDLSDNELELWYSAQDRFEVSLRTPDGIWLPWVRPGEFLHTRAVHYGPPDPVTGDRKRCFVRMFNQRYYPANGANYISIYLLPEFDPQDPTGPIHGIQPGQWTVRLRGLRVRDGRFHAWIERDDPGELGRVGSRWFWTFPSFFSERSNVDRSSVSSLACGHRVLSVANLDVAREQVHITSSQGPTRDGRAKPDVAAPGTDVPAAFGFHDPGHAPWVRMTGTSMASPYVCGVAAQMLRVNPDLSAAQIGAIIQATARPLPGADYRWRDDAGYGVIDEDACLLEAGRVGAETGV